MWTLQGMDMSDRSEQALWERGAAGDGEAFGRIFDLHRDRVFRSAYRLLQDAHEAEDASAAAFLELWRRRHRVRLVDGSPLPWLLVTTTNACRNLDRAKRRYQKLLDALPHEPPVSSAEDVALNNLATDRELAEALKLLTRSDAELFALVAVQGYTIADAALALGLSPGAARTRLHRARNTLQRQLGHRTLTGYLATEA